MLGQGQYNNSRVLNQIIKSGSLCEFEWGKEIMLLNAPYHLIVTPSHHTNKLID